MIISVKSINLCNQNVLVSIFHIYYTVHVKKKINNSVLTGHWTDYMFNPIKYFFSSLLKFFDSEMSFADKGRLAQTLTPENLSDFFPNSVLAFIREKQEFCLSCGVSMCRQFKKVRKSFWTIIINH